MKSAIFIERRIKKTGGLAYWAGYFYAQNVDDPGSYEFVKNSVDQWGKPVKVYRGKTVSHLSTPGGLEASDLVILFEGNPILNDSPS